MSKVCRPSLFDNNFNYIKIGNGLLMAVEGANITEKLLLSDLRIPYKQILKGKIVLKAGKVNYLLNYLGLGDNVTFLAIKANYCHKSIEEDNYVIWKRFDNIHIENHFAQLMILTGNSKERIPQLFLTNPNDKCDVTLEVMVAIIDGNSSYFNYKPVVYFTDRVTMDGKEYTEPFNTSMGDEFSATFSYLGATISKLDVMDQIVDEVRDSNGAIMTTTEDNYLLYDYSDNEIIGITGVGTYSLYFDITDYYGNSVDPVDKVIISITGLL